MCFLNLMYSRHYDEKEARSSFTHEARYPVCSANERPGYSGYFKATLFYCIKIWAWLVFRSTRSATSKAEKSVVNWTNLSFCRSNDFLCALSIHSGSTAVDFSSFTSSGGTKGWSIRSIGTFEQSFGDCFSSDGNFFRVEELCALLKRVIKYRRRRNQKFSPANISVRKAPACSRMSSKIASAAAMGNSTNSERNHALELCHRRKKW